MPTNIDGTMSPRYADKQSSDVHSSSTSHQDLFDKLATETVGEIFNYAYPVVDLPTISDSNSNPAILSMVCKRWHAITMLNHSLWATITIHTPRISHKGWLAWGVLQVGRYIERSGDHPLDIHVDEGDSDTDETVISAILDVITPHSERWRRAAFTFEWGRKFSQRFDTLNNRLPLLEHLEMHLYDDTQTFEDWPACTAFLSSPRLKSLGISPSMGTEFLQQIQMPRTQILEVIFSVGLFWHQDTLHEMLGLLSVSLQSLTFESFGMRLLPGPVESSTTTLTQLQRLCFSANCHSIPDMLICPSLEELEIDSGHEDLIARFLDRSSCALIHVKLQHPMRTVLHHKSLSTLKSLYLRIPTNNDSTLELLNFDSHHLFPLLETLKIHLWFEGHGDDGPGHLFSQIQELRRVVDSRTRSMALNQSESSVDGFQYTEIRWEARSSLKKFVCTFNLQLDGPDYWDKESIQALQSFCISQNVQILLRISHW